MQTVFTTEACAIAGLSLDRNYKKYTLSIKVGTYYTFDYSEISNQVHYHDSYEMVIVISGRGTFIYNKQNKVLSKGDIFISEPYIEHEIHIDPTETLTLLYFFISIEEKSAGVSQTFEEKLIEGFIHQHHNILQNQYQIVAYLSFFDRYTQNPKFKNNIWFYKMLENMILNCLELLTISGHNQTLLVGKLETNLFERALDYIDQNLGKKLSAEIIAQEICTSRRNLYVLFRKNLNKTVHDYISEKKISLAEHYLILNLSVTEAANSVGIESLSYFNKLFRKYKGMSPREYVKDVIPNKEGYGRRHVKTD
ncbi:MAG: helix-turn-helix transcriptional regulator [Vallitaleaceae bacterium]|nr:helix-turn-helix transcriptional regulator [Vallitaleaceae bacterium]